MLNLSNQNFKSKAELKALAPSIFTKKASKDVTEKYTHIPTEKVIDDMENLGWFVVDAKEVKARKKSTVSFQKHLIVFRNPDIAIIGEEGNDVFPQILLTNSHDGKNAFTFIAGLFRMICENGLVVSTSEFENVKMRHMGYTFEALQVQIKEMVEKLPLTVESMNKMIATELTPKQKFSFAKKCVGLRFGEDGKNIKVNLKELLVPTRDEDKGNSLWNVFNVIQEKLMDGDFNYTSGVKLRKARRIKNFTQDIALNSQLFDVALTYAA